MSIYMATAADGGSDSNGGTGWGDAVLTLSKAIDLVALGTTDTIYVRAGTYAPGTHGDTLNNTGNGCVNSPLGCVSAGSMRYSISFIVHLVWT